MKESNSSELKDNLIEHFDFVVVSCEIWKHLYSWYSADWTVVRFMRRDRTNKRAFFLDLYPEKSKLINEIDDNDICESDSERKFLTS